MNIGDTSRISEPLESHVFLLLLFFYAVYPYSVPTQKNFLMPQ